MNIASFLRLYRTATYGTIGKRTPAPEFLDQHRDFLNGFPELKPFLFAFDQREAFASQTLALCVQALDGRPEPATLTKAAPISGKVSKSNPPPKDEGEERKPKVLTQIFGSGFQVVWKIPIIKNGKQAWEKKREVFPGKHSALQFAKLLEEKGIWGEVSIEIEAENKFATVFEAEKWAVRRCAESQTAVRAIVEDPARGCCMIIGRKEAIYRNQAIKHSTATKTTVKYASRLGSSVRTHETRCQFSRG